MFLPAMTWRGLVRSFLLLCCLSAGWRTAQGSADDSSSAHTSILRKPAAGANVSAHTAENKTQHNLLAVEQLLADYYAGKLQPAQPAAAGAVVREASVQHFPWAKPEWGRYRQRAVVYTDPSNAGVFAIWAWDNVPEAAVRQAQVVLTAMTNELSSDIKRTLASSPSSKAALFKRPEQVWTDIPEHSIWKGTDFGAGDLSGVGGTAAVPVSSFDIRNVMEEADDPYREESVVVHEFGHHIHNLALSACVADAADAAYANAVSSGAYMAGRYMISSVHEYMANAVAAWFQGTCRSDVNDGIVSRPRLLARDPTLFSLLQYIFTPSVVRVTYRSLCPACRTKWTPEAQVAWLEPVLPAPLIKLPLERCVGLASNWRPVPHIAPDCTDLDANCRVSAIAGQCDTQPRMLSRCQLSCGVCRQVSSSAACFDRDPSCLVAASVQGRCQGDSLGMGPQGLGCMLSCGNCTAAQSSTRTDAPA